jgi:hypothetical protein
MLPPQSEFARGPGIFSYAGLQSPNTHRRSFGHIQGMNKSPHSRSSLCREVADHPGPVVCSKMVVPLPKPPARNLCRASLRETTS